MQFWFGCPLQHFIVLDVEYPIVRAEQEACVTFRCAFLFFSQFLPLRSKCFPRTLLQDIYIFYLSLRFRDRAARAYEVTG